MAGRDLQLKIGADDSEVTRTFASLNGKAKAAGTQLDQNLSQAARGAQTKLSALGTSVSGLGFALGSIQGKSGQAISALGNLANVLGSAGPVGVAVAAATTGIAMLSAKFFEHRAAAEDAAKAVKDKYAAALRELRELNTSGLDPFAAAQSEELSAARALRDIEQEIRSERRSARLEDKAVSDETMSALSDELAQRQLELEVARKRVAIMREAREKSYVEENKREAEAIAAAEIQLAEKIERDKKARIERVAAAQKKAADEDLKEQKEIARKLKEARDAMYAEEMAQDAWRKQARADEMHNAELQRRQQEQFAQESRKQQREYREMRQAEARAFAEETATHASYVSSSITDVAAAYGQLDKDRRDGSKMTAAEMQQRERDIWTTAALSATAYISQVAMQKGIVLAIEGAAMAAVGTPGGAAQLALGAVLFGLGAGGMAGTAYLGGRYLGASVSPVTQSRQDGRQQTVSSPSRYSGESSSGGQTTIQYVFTGPVFGNADDAARAVARMNRRGMELAA